MYFTPKEEEESNSNVQTGMGIILKADHILSLYVHADKVSLNESRQLNAIASSISQGITQLVQHKSVNMAGDVQIHRGSRNGTSQGGPPPVLIAYDNWRTCISPRV